MAAHMFVGGPRGDKRRMISDDLEGCSQCSILVMWNDALTNGALEMVYRREGDVFRYVHTKCACGKCNGDIVPDEQVKTATMKAVLMA